MKGRWIPVAATLLLGVACSEPTLAPNRSASTNDAVFDALWKEFDLQYSFFQVKGIDWNQMRDTYRPRAIAAASDAELAKVLGEMLAQLRDRHVTLTPGAGAATISYLSRSDTGVAAFDASMIDRRYLTGAGRTEGGHVNYGWVSPGMGYIRIPTFEGRGWVDELDVALGALKDAQSLVVDIRGNVGGTLSIALEAAGRFATSSQIFSYVRIRNGPEHGDFTSMSPQYVRPAGPTQFRGQVIVLTNRRVYSSAENFVLAMGALPTVTTMGDTTAGASGRPVTRELPNGWTYTLSTWIEYTLDKQIYENVGIAPDVYVPARVVEVRAGTDSVLDRAVSTLKASKL